MKSRYLLYTMLVALMLSFPFVSFAKGRHVNYDNSKTSNVVVIGDSRIAYLALEVKKYPKKREKFSFNAVSAGHYIIREQFSTGEYAQSPLQINHPNYVKEQKLLIKNCLKRHGKCIVVLEATINDTSNTNKAMEQESVKKIEELRRKLKAIRVKYKGKYRAPKIYVTSVIPPLNNDDRVLWINSYLRQKYGSAYIYLGMNPTWFPYYCDTLHFTGDGSYLLYRKIKKAIGK